MIIYLYGQYRKRENSTKVPLVSEATRTVNGYLREPCSIMNPTFKIERFPSDASPQSFNYAYIPEFARWYFVKDWTWADGLWLCSMAVDVLASFKTDIGNTQAYIDRCSAEYDGSIVDGQYVATTNFNLESHDITTSWHNINPAMGGCYIVGIINGDSVTLSQTGGAVTYYAMTIFECQNLMQYLLSADFLDDAGFSVIQTATQQLTQDTAKAFVKPIDYISSVTWFPLSITAFTQASETAIQVGYWKVSASIATGKVVQAYTVLLHCGVTVPLHPQAATRGKYLNYAPYTRMSIELPPFGNIPIDPSYCEIGSYLYCDIWLDSITGKAELIVKVEPDAQHLDDNDVVVANASGMMGVPIQISQINADYFHAGVSLAMAGGSIVSGIGHLFSLDPGNAIGKVNESASHILNAIDCMMPQIRTQGIDGSFLYTFIQPRLCVQHFILVPEDNEELGRPLRAKRYIRDLPGFVKCYEVTVDYPCFDEEKAQISRYLYNGFFWE